MKPVAPVRKTFTPYLLDNNPWVARSRAKDILRIITWARDNGVKVASLTPDQISEALAGGGRDERRTPRFRIFSVQDD
jgi:hypothetical protein